MNVARLVGATLARLGVGHTFGVVGSGNFEVTNALRAEGVPYVAARHEGGAATMADAYARMSGRVGVLSTHQGCGFTNALTGIGEAAKSRTPLLVVTADIAGAAVLSNFRVDQHALAAAVGAVPERVYGAASAVADTVRAYRAAVQQRRTVVLNLPLDVQAQPATDAALDAVQPVTPAAPVRPDQASVAALAELLAGAARPVFLAGRFCFTQAFQSIGLGLATAIGAALARPDRLPVAALGDGGFHLSVAELETAVRLRLPLVVVVYHDAAYGAEVHHFTEASADELASVRFPDTDLAALARGFGCAGLTVRTVDDLAGLSDWLAGARDRPLVIDAKVANDGGSWWLAEAFQGH
jgi:thiamine pyrophosphate-dependent acetolactate synthase large subunit-like protein